MDKKQTAVEWLMENLHTAKDPFTQAKAMEKEQIIDAYDIGFADAWDDARYDDEPKYATAEQYYNETYTND